MSTVTTVPVTSPNSLFGSVITLFDFTFIPWLFVQNISNFDKNYSYLSAAKNGYLKIYNIISECLITVATYFYFRTLALQ